MLSYLKGDALYFLIEDVTMREKSRFIRIISWEVLQLIFITWVIERALDFLVKRLSIRLKGEVFLRYRYWKMFGSILLPTYLSYIFSFRTLPMYEVYSESKFFNLIVRSTLYGHRMMHKHKVLKIDKCEYCKTIIENKSFLQTYVSDSKLYPPFKFSGGVT